MTNRLLVVGGGIAGFGLARALSLRGVSCTLVERLPAPPGSGLGLNLPGNAVRALAALGLAEEVVDRGMRIRRREYRNQAGRLLFSVDEEAFWGEVGPSVCLRRGDLLEVLRASTPEVAPRWDTPLAGAELVDQGVRVQLASGPAEIYDFVVGADGVHSSVRRAVIPEADPRRSLMTEASWRFTAPNPGVDCWSVWSGGRGTFLLIPVDENHVYGYAAATRGGAAGDDPRWLEATFAGFPEPVAGTIGAVLGADDELYYSPVEEVRCQRWSRGRLVLVGDAAHATGPVWAQGAALALEDAIVLADLWGGIEIGTAGLLGAWSRSCAAGGVPGSRHPADGAGREVALWPLTVSNGPSRPLPRTIPGSHGDPEWRRRFLPRSRYPAHRAVRRPAGAPGVPNRRRGEPHAKGVRLQGPVGSDPARRAAPHAGRCP